MEPETNKKPLFCNVKTRLGDFPLALVLIQNDVPAKATFFYQKNELYFCEGIYIQLCSPLQLYSLIMMINSPSARAQNQKNTASTPQKTLRAEESPERKEGPEHLQGRGQRRRGGGGGGVRLQSSHLVSYTGKTAKKKSN